MKKLLCRLIAVQLWVYALFVPFVIWVLQTHGEVFFKENFIGRLMVRLPYHWDLELFFSSIYIVWGYFLWSTKSYTMRHFTAWAYLSHAVMMIVVGYFKKGDTLHLLQDSIWWFVPGLLLLFLLKKDYELPS